MRLGVCSSVNVADADRQTAPLADSMLLDDSHLLEATRACSFSHLVALLAFGHPELPGYSTVGNTNSDQCTLTLDKSGTRGNRTSSLYCI